MGELEETLALADRAREGALLVPEQLRLEQLVQQRGAVDGQKRLIAPLADPVHVARGQLLAAAALALDEDVRVRVARARQELPQPLYGAALALHGGLGLMLEDNAPQGPVLVAEPTVLGGPGHDLVELAQAEGLGDIVEGAELEGLDGGLDLGIARDDDDLGVIALRPHGLQDLDAVLAGHAQVHEDDVELLPGEGPEGGLTVPGSADEVPFPLEPGDDRVGQSWVVLDDQQPSRLDGTFYDFAFHASRGAFRSHNGYSMPGCPPRKESHHGPASMPQPTEMSNVLAVSERRRPRPITRTWPKNCLDSRILTDRSPTSFPCDSCGWSMPGGDSLRAGSVPSPSSSLAH